MAVPVEKFRILDEFHVFRVEDVGPEAEAARAASAGDGLPAPKPVPLYSGRASSRNEFVKSLIAAGYSMEGADLHGVVLSGCNLENISFRNARLSRVKMNGVKASGCDFSGARIENATIGGADLRLANFTGAHVSGCDFDKSTLTGASFASAEIADTDFLKIHAANLDLRFSSLSRVRFDDASLSRVDLRGARLAACSFKGADLRSHTEREREKQAKAGMPVAASGTGPDFSFGTIAAACDYRDALISEDHPNLLRDRRNSRIGSGIAWLLTSTIVGAGIGIPLDNLGLAEMAIDAIGHAGASMVVLPLVKVATDAILDAIKSKFSRVQENALDRVRHTIETARVFFRHKKDTLVAFVNPRRSPTIVEALRACARPGEKLRFFDVVGSRDVHLVVADAKHFRAAFQHLVLRQDTGLTYRDDVSILLSREFEGVPRAMRFLKDGSCTAVWYEGGVPAYSATFDRNGELVPDMTFLPDGIEPPVRAEIVEMFQDAVLSFSDTPVEPRKGRKMRLDIDRNGNPIRVPTRGDGARGIVRAIRQGDFLEAVNIEPDDTTIVAGRPRQGVGS